VRKFLDSDQLRKDLFYRINGLTLTIAPLRERPRDLRSLVAAQIARAGDQQGKAITGLSTAAAELLFNHHWPGNLRELDRVIRAAVAMTSGNVIGAEAIILDPGSSSAAPRQTVDEAREPEGDERLEAVERRHVRRVLEKLRGNKARAARTLGISRSTLDRKLASD
jgi:transcriptional regulator with PAS, ATPase and Fis domain